MTFTELKIGSGFLLEDFFAVKTPNLVRVKKLQKNRYSGKSVDIGMFAHGAVSGCEFFVLHTRGILDLHK